jgi:predicted transcriptional regulator
MRYNGYWNNNKSDYYLKTLQEKGCISIADKIKEQIRYKITQKGIDIISHIDQCYSEALIKFCEKNNIEL